MARTPAENRRYYENRMAKKAALGRTTSQARGHAKTDELPVSKAKARAKETGLTERQVNDTTRVVGLDAGRDTKAAVTPAGTFLDTSNKRDAMRTLRRLQKGELVQLIFTRRDGWGVPLYGAGKGTHAGNLPRRQGPQPHTGGSQGAGERGKFSAARFVEIVDNDYGGDLWDAAEGERDDDKYPSTSPIYRVHIAITRAA